MFCLLVNSFFPGNFVLIFTGQDDADSKVEDPHMSEIAYIYFQFQYHRPKHLPPLTSFQLRTMSYCCVRGWMSWCLCSNSRRENEQRKKGRRGGNVTQFTCLIHRTSINLFVVSFHTCSVSSEALLYQKAFFPAGWKASQVLCSPVFSGFFQLFLWLYLLPHFHLLLSSLSSYTLSPLVLPFLVTHYYWFIPCHTSKHSF